MKSGEDVKWNHHLRHWNDLSWLRRMSTGTLPACTGQCSCHSGTIDRTAPALCRSAPDRMPGWIQQRGCRCARRHHSRKRATSHWRRGRCLVILARSRSTTTRTDLSRSLGGWPNSLGCACPLYWGNCQPGRTLRSVGPPTQGPAVCGYADGQFPPNCRCRTNPRSTPTCRHCPDRPQEVHWSTAAVH